VRIFHNDDRPILWRQNANEGAATNCNQWIVHRSERFSRIDTMMPFAWRQKSLLFQIKQECAKMDVSAGGALR
jgi:hypothetical protein